MDRSDITISAGVINSTGCYMKVDSKYDLPTSFFITGMNFIRLIMLFFMNSRVVPVPLFVIGITIRSLTYS